MLATTTALLAAHLRDIIQSKTSSKTQKTHHKSHPLSSPLKQITRCSQNSIHSADSLATKTCFACSIPQIYHPIQISKQKAKETTQVPPALTAIDADHILPSKLQSQRRFACNKDSFACSASIRHHESKHASKSIHSLVENVSNSSSGWG